MGISLDDLQYVLIPANEPQDGYRSSYEAAYRLWQKVWSSTLKELDGAPIVFSDDFCRQTLVGALFLGNRCITLGLFHEVDFKLETAGHDSYFKVWPREAIQKLTEKGPRVLVGSNITVDPEFRGDQGGGLFLKNLIVGMMVRTLLNSRADVMTGTMRCNRGMDRSAQLYGATPLLEGVFHHGVEVQLVAFYRQLITASRAVARDATVEALWRDRDDLTSTLNKEITDDRHSESGPRRDGKDPGRYY